MADRFDVPVLAYHSIDTRGTPISMAPQRFRTQMEHLHTHGRRAVSLRAWLRGEADDIEGAFVLTFDDGYRNNFDVAMGLLRDLDFTATVFVVTDHVGRTANWSSNDLLGDEPMLDWNQLQELSRSGFDLHPHTATHPKLDELPDARLREEIDQSRDALEQRLGRTCDVFCAPHGRFDQRVIEHLRVREYTGAVTTRFAYPTRENSPYEIPRLGSAWFRSHPRTFSWFMRGRRSCAMTLAAGGAWRRLRGRRP